MDHLKAGLDRAVAKVDALASRFALDRDGALTRLLHLARLDSLTGRGTPSFPSGFSRNLRYQAAGNTDWTPGFWIGLLWLAYEYTGDQKYRTLAESYLPSFRDRLNRGGPGVQTHDLGFLYILSCVAAYKLTGRTEARKIALHAANLLSERYFGKGRIIQAWGRLNDPDERGRIIIDSTMNMPLLFWAAAATGDETYSSIARNHLHQIARYLVREDGSTWHTYYINPDTGAGRFVLPELSVDVVTEDLP